MIGLGWKLEVNDGEADAFAVINDITSLDIPDDGPYGMVEKKTLDISGGQVTREATVKTPGAFSFTYEFSAAQYTRLGLLKGTAKNWKASSNEGSPWTRTVPGVLSQQLINGVSADGKVLVTVTVEVTGAAS